MDSATVVAIHNLRTFDVKLMKHFFQRDIQLLLLSSS